jgi:hypothetical protein
MISSAKTLAHSAASHLSDFDFCRIVPTHEAAWQSKMPTILASLAASLNSWIHPGKGGASLGDA